jgi:hypothetical protein
VHTDLKTIVLQVPRSALPTSSGIAFVLSSNTKTGYMGRFRNWLPAGLAGARPAATKLLERFIASLYGYQSISFQIY